MICEHCDAELVVPVSYPCPSCKGRLCHQCHIRNKKLPCAETKFDMYIDQERSKQNRDKSPERPEKEKQFWAMKLKSGKETKKVFYFTDKNKLERAVSLAHFMDFGFMREYDTVVCKVFNKSS